jgi:glycosyltransferase involved in cell wall biosynthesis
MKVLMVTGAYYPEISSGGLQSRLMSAAMRGRAEVRVLTTATDRRTPRRAIVDEVEVTRIHVRVDSAVSKTAALGVMVPDLWRLVRWCDVVHIHGVSSKNIVVTTAARLFGKPIVLSLHTRGEDEPAAVRRKGSASWWAFTSVSRYLSVSPSLTQAYLDAGLPADRLEQVGNGIDTDLFSPASIEERRRLRQANTIDADRPLIVFVGFFSHDKQPDVLFDAWLRLRDRYAIDATLVYVGATKSEYREVDERLAATIRASADARGVGDRVVFAGERHDVHNFFRMADAFVLPSRREGLPVALLEAMSCALPSIASRLAGATDTLIDHEVSGLLVPAGDVDAFADAMRAMLGDRDRANRMGQQARQFVMQRYDASAIAAKWLANYRAAIDRSGVDRS